MINKTQTLAENKVNASSRVIGASGIFFQPKLTINNPSDKYEQEADAMADKVMRMEQPGIQLKPLSITSLQRKCAHCEEQKVNRKEINREETTADSSVENYIGSLSSSGQQLSNEVRNFYEPRFGYDFSNVKVHTDSIAAKSAQSINALAYTSGNNIVFNNGQYSPNSDSGKRLMGHELTHVVQQTTQIQRKPTTVTNEEPTEEIRKEFAEIQKRFSEEQGKIMKNQILQSAGFAKGIDASTPEDAEKLIKFWGLSMSTIVTQMAQISSSLSTQVVGQTTTTSLAQQQKTFVDALSAQGQLAYKKAVKLVKDEPFWNNYFNTNEIFIFPDLQGGNRFSGYNQAVPDPNDPTGQKKVIIVHISQIHLNNNFPELSASTIVHELSHVIYDPSVLERALAPFKNSIAALLVDHPQIIATRKGAKDPVAAKEQQQKRISQILYETLAYGEEEIFVHLQQLTHQPDVTVTKSDGTQESLRGAQLLQHEVLRYIQRLQKIGLEKRMLQGVLGQIGRRVDIMYDNRIAAFPKGSKQRGIMEAQKKMAQLIFEMALKGDKL